MYIYTYIHAYGNAFGRNDKTRLFKTLRMSSGRCEHVHVRIFQYIDIYICICTYVWQCLGRTRQDLSRSLNILLVSVWRFEYVSVSMCGYRHCQLSPPLS